MSGLLDGVRVLDLTNVLAGPVAGYQLALLGADVVKVELPGTGDLARQLGADPGLSSRNLGASFLAQNGGKRSVTVDLKSDGGREVFRRLLGIADVLLENFRPGVLARLGFAAEQLRAEFPGLVYCAVSGFGATGPDSDRPAYDQVVQGMAGVMSVTGTAAGGPLRVGYPVCDSIGGLAAAFAVAAALVRRQRTGEGAYLDVSMLDAALTTMGWVVSDYLVAGREPAPMGNENRTSAPSGTFRTADGALNIAANRQQQFERLCDAVGRPELLDDPRFGTREDRKAHRAELTAALEETLRCRPAAHWDALLTRAGVPAGPVVSVPDALASAQVRHRGLVSTVASAAGDLSLLGLPTRVDGQPVPPSSPPPVLGEHTDEVLAELGYAPSEIAALHEAGAV
ncbi:CaiB/BaiF CoA transferase family protein [Nocardioides mesophilus]|uniref:CoA transferase n=1 Tax=Nocardioides mesophilus TaxID=433659 RepID=A0A7G9RE23_9ACTN|nr:CaiB/BaiF CoA-transferase family protein [Nocardioides mesophilus]QNN53848.1 CoA transferase [Nocardioides mesophilus]